VAEQEDRAIARALERRVISLGDVHHAAQTYTLSQLQRASSLRCLIEIHLRAVYRHIREGQKYNRYDALARRPPDCTLAHSKRLENWRMGLLEGLRYWRNLTKPAFFVQFARRAETRGRFFRQPLVPLGWVRNLIVLALE